MKSLSKISTRKFNSLKNLIDCYR